MSLMTRDEIIRALAHAREEKERVFAEHHSTRVPGMMLWTGHIIAYRAVLGIPEGEPDPEPTQEGAKA